MKFIKLTKVFIHDDEIKEARIIYINIDKVKVLEPFENFTSVNIEDFSDMIRVKETPEEIMEMINGWQDGGIVLDNRRCKFRGDLIIFSKPDEVQNLTYENKDIDLTLLSNQKQNIIRVIPESEKTITVETDSAFWKLMIDGRYNIQVSKTMEK